MLSINLIEFVYQTCNDHDLSITGVSTLQLHHVHESTQELSFVLRANRGLQLHTGIIHANDTTFSLS